MVTSYRVDNDNSEKVLVNRHSAFQPILLTQDSAGFITLRFGLEEPRQSVVKLGDPSHLELAYARALPACLAFAPEPHRVLIVGLGAGSLPQFFHHHFPQMLIDVVELDPDVLKVAEEFCGFGESARMKVYVQDGRDFVESRRGAYDLIVLDCFGNDAMPPHLATLEFLTLVREALSSKGVVATNIWGPASNPHYGSMLLTYQATFKEVYVLDVPGPGTKIFVALQAPQQMNRLELLESLRKISRTHGFAFDVSGVIAGFRSAKQERVRGGGVLRDQSASGIM
jgi:spermidine synthase